MPIKQNRYDQILKLIVEDFIDTAEPVGSMTLLEKYNLDCSSATIRNDMMQLEKEGLIEKTHHSSGRVPSAKGYRYYLEHIKNSEQSYEVDEEFKKEFALVLQKKSQAVEEVMEKSCQILSEMTNLATIVVGPKASQDLLASIQVIPLNSNTVTAIIVTDKGYVENKTFSINDQTYVNDIVQAVKLINKRLVGTPIEELADKLNSIRPLISDLLGERTNIIMEAFMEAFMKFARKRLETFGTSKLLELPEYEKEKNNLLNVVKFLDNPEKINSEIQNLDDSIEVKDDENMAIVTKNVDINGQNSGKIAVVGPKRMNYKKILASLEYVAKTLKQYYEQQGKDDDDE